MTCGLRSSLISTRVSKIEVNPHFNYHSSPSFPFISFSWVLSCIMQASCFLKVINKTPRSAQGSNFQTLPSVAAGTSSLHLLFYMHKTTFQTRRFGIWHDINSDQPSAVKDRNDQTHYSNCSQHNNCLSCLWKFATGLFLWITWIAFSHFKSCSLIAYQHKMSQPHHAAQPLIALAFRRLIPVFGVLINLLFFSISVKGRLKFQTVSVS